MTFLNLLYNRPLPNSTLFSSFVLFSAVSETSMNFNNSKLDCKTIGSFFLKIGLTERKSLAREPYTPVGSVRHLSPVSPSVFSLASDLLLDCSGVLEYSKIRTVLQSISKLVY